MNTTTQPGPLEVRLSDQLGRTEPEHCGWQTGGSPSACSSGAVPAAGFAGSAELNFNPTQTTIHKTRNKMIESNYFKIDGVWHCRRGADVLRQEIVVREVTGRNGSCVKVTGPVWVAAKLPKKQKVQHAVA